MSRAMAGITIALEVRPASLREGHQGVTLYIPLCLTTVSDEPPLVLGFESNYEALFIMPDYSVSS